MDETRYAELEQALIVDTLERARGDVATAAHLLGWTGSASPPGSFTSVWCPRTTAAGAT